MSRDARIIWADPVRSLADALRSEAAHHKSQWGDEERATQLVRMAERLDAAIEAGGSATWVPVRDAATLLHRHVETVRVRCRRHLKAAGLARKQGGDWYVHVNALAA